MYSSVDKKIELQTALFKFFFFPTFENSVNNLLLKMNRNSVIALRQVLRKEDNTVLQRNLDFNIPINVLILSETDLNQIQSWDFSFIAQKTEESKGSCCFIVAGIDIPDNKVPMIKGIEYWPLHDVDEELRRALVQFNNKRLRANYLFSPFVGRHQELNQFDSLLYSEAYDKTKVVIVSGHPGIGREAFVWECARKVMKDPDYEPYTISIGDNGNIEMLLVQLNSIRHRLPEQTLKDIIRGEVAGKVAATVSLINELLREKHCLVIYDDSKSCVRFDRKVSDWFKEVVFHPDLQGGMRIFVVSTISVNYRRPRAEDGMSFFTLYDLTRPDRKKLIYSYLSTNSLSLAEQDVNEILDSAVYSPNIMLKLLNDIKEYGVNYFMNNKRDYEDASAKNLRTVILRYKSMENADAWNLLVFLSKIEFVSDSLLIEAFEDGFKSLRGCLEMLVTDGLLERFGEWMEYYRLEGSVSDIMRRNKYTYEDSSLRIHLREDLTDVVGRHARITEDYSAFLYMVKKGIERGNIDDDALLIPSILVTTISQTYDAKKWDTVIDLCEKVLSFQPHYFPQIKRELYYWYCLALARRKKEDRFYEIVEIFKGSADYFFLKGFYLRNAMQYARAEDAYRTALSINPSFARAKREMVNVLQRQHKFAEALELAKENYERDPSNSYHMLAYYRCLVRKPVRNDAENERLKDFLRDAKDMFRSPSFVKGMQFEYARFVDKEKPDKLLPVASKLEKENISSTNYIKDIISEYRVSQGLEPTMRPLPLDDEIDE